MTGRGWRGGEGHTGSQLGKVKGHRVKPVLDLRDPWLVETVSPFVGEFVSDGQWCLAAQVVHKPVEQR